MLQNKHWNCRNTKTRILTDWSNRMCASALFTWTGYRDRTNNCM